MNLENQRWKRKLLRLGKILANPLQCISRIVYQNSPTIDYVYDRTPFVKYLTSNLDRFVDARGIPIPLTAFVVVRLVISSTIFVFLIFSLTNSLAMSCKGFIPSGSVRLTGSENA